MTTPSPRNSIRTARGLYSDLLASVADLGDGELCYSIDHDKFYTPDGSGGLLEVGKGTAIASIGQLGDVDLTGLQSGEVLKYGSSWSPAADSAPVSSVAGKTGTVTLVKADITDFYDADYATAVQGAADSAVQPGDDISDLNNDSGFITSADVDAVPVAGGQFTGDVEIGAGIDLNTNGSALFTGTVESTNTSFDSNLLQLQATAESIFMLANRAILVPQTICFMVRTQREKLFRF